MSKFKVGDRVVYKHSYPKNYFARDMMSMEFTSSVLTVLEYYEEPNRIYITWNNGGNHWEVNAEDFLLFNEETPTKLLDLV